MTAGLFGTVVEIGFGSGLNMPADLVRGAGFTIERVESRYADGPKPWTWLTEGAAIKPS